MGYYERRPIVARKPIEKNHDGVLFVIIAGIYVVSSLYVWLHDIVRLEDWIW